MGKKETISPRKCSPWRIFSITEDSPFPISGHYCVPQDLWEHYDFLLEKIKEANNHPKIMRPDDSELSKLCRELLDVCVVEFNEQFKKFRISSPRALTFYRPKGQ